MIDAVKVRFYSRLVIIISSPMKRTKKTAKIIAKEIGYKNDIIYFDELMEIDLGLTAIGKKDDELRKDNFYDEFFKLMDEYDKKDRIEQLELNDNPPKIFSEKYKLESIESIKSRVEFIIDYIKNCSHKKILIVSHNGVIEWINRIILNTAETIKGNLSGGKNCHITYYTLKQNKFRLIMGPSTTHLHH